MSPAVDTVAEVVRRLGAGSAPAGGTRVLAVDGRSGAGKTTLAGLLSAALHDAPVVPMEHLYPGWDGLAVATDALVKQVLEPLAAGRPAAYRRWDWAAGAFGARIEVPAAPVVVVEGVGCGGRAAAPHLSLLVWLQAPDNVRRVRALARDGATYAPHWERWAAQERAYVAREDPMSRAGLVVASSELPGSTPTLPGCEQPRSGPRRSRL